MKVVFLLDNNEYVEVAPEKLQIRQINTGLTALGYEVTLPLKKEDGTPELNEDGTPKTQTGFRPFINYQVNLYVPGATPQDDVKNLKALIKAKLAEVKAAQAAAAAAEKAAAATATAESKKAKAAKRRVN